MSSHLEDYKKARQEQIQSPDSVNQFYNTVEQRGIRGWGTRDIDYDADQLMEYFENRNKDEEGFEARKKYYFTDSRMGEAKIRQYQRYANDEGGITSAHAWIYGNHYAWKRKSNASSAVKYFRAMQQRMNRYAKDDTKLLDSYTKYLHKEEIMTYRLKGMLAAAETKSKYSEHEKYLKGRAKLSCNMLLKDQLCHYLQDENKKLLKDTNIIDKLQAKLNSVEGKIKDAYDEIKENTPSVQDTWRDIYNINDRKVKEKYRQYQNRNPMISVYTAKVLLPLETIQEQNKDIQWPQCVVLTDKVGGPLNIAETNRKKFNDQYAQNENNPVAKEKLEEEAIKRFERINLPTPSELADKNLVKYIYKNTRDYYELTKLALPYYMDQMKKQGTVKAYADKHPEFLKRLYYVNAINEFIDYALRSDHMIQYYKGKFDFERDNRYKVYQKGDGGWTRDNAYGQNEGQARYRDLVQAFKNYGKADFVPKLKPGINKQINIDDKNLIVNEINTNKNIIIEEEINTGEINQKAEEKQQDRILVNEIKVDGKTIRTWKKKIDYVGMSENIPDDEYEYIDEIIEDNQNKEQIKEQNIIQIKKDDNIEDQKEEKKENQKKDLDSLIKLPKEDNKEEEDPFKDEAPFNINGYMAELDAKEKEKKQNKESEKKESEIKEELKDDKKDNIILEKKETDNNQINIIEEEQEDELSQEDISKYNRLCQDNPKVNFSKEDYVIYKIILDANQVSHSERNKKAMDKGVKDRVFVGREQIALSKLSEAPAPLLKGCRFKTVLIQGTDNRTHQREKGITDADEEIRKKNTAWLKLWMTTDNTALREKYIKDNLPKMFDDFKWPTVKELTDGSAFKGERLFEIMDMIRRIRGLYSLTQMSKAAKEVMAEPEFTAKYDAILSLEQYLITYLRVNHSIDIKPAKGGEVSLFVEDDFSTKEFAQDEDFEEFSDKDFATVLKNKLEHYQEVLENNKAILFAKKEDQKQQKAFNAPKFEMVQGADIIKKALEDRAGVNKNKIYHKLMEQANPFMTSSDSGKTIDRCCGFFLKYARFNEDGTPLTKEDEASHKWNLDFLKTWEKGKEDPMKMGQMIGEYLPHVYDDIELPPYPKTIDLADMEQKEYVKQLDAWCEKLVQNPRKLEEFMYKAGSSSSLDVLKKTIPGLSNYMNNNPKLMATKQLLDLAWIYLDKYIVEKYHINSNSGEFVAPASLKDSIAVAQQAKKQMAFMLANTHVNQKANLQGKLKNFDTSNMKLMFEDFKKAVREEEKKQKELEEQNRQEKKEEEKEEKKEEKDENENRINLDKEIKEENQNKIVVENEIKEENKIIEENEIKEERKEFSSKEEERAYILQQLQTYTKVKDNPQYIDLFANKSNLLLVNGLAKRSIDRGTTFMLKYVRFDKDGNPLTRKDQENHKWNLEWLGAWENKKENPKKIVDMAAEYAPHAFDDVTLPPVPKVKGEITDTDVKAYRASLDKWCEELIHSGNLDAFLYKTGLGLSIDNMKKKVPGFKEYYDANKETRIGAMEELVSHLWLYLKEYLVHNYNLDANDNNGKVGVDEKTAQENSNNMMGMYANMLMADMKALELAKDKKEVPYNKSYSDDFAYDLEMNRRLPEDLQKKVKGFETFKLILGNFNASSEYKQLINDANKCLTKGAASNSVDRTCMCMFKMVHFGKNEKPISKEDQENHEWNKNFLKNWQGTGEHINELGRMFNDYLPHMFDGIELPSVPKVDLSKLSPKDKDAYITEFQHTLEDWCEKLMSDPEKVEKFLFVAKKTLSVDNLLKNVPGLRDCFAANKAIDSLYTALGVMTGFINGYTTQKYSYDVINVRWTKYKKADIDTNQKNYAGLILDALSQHEANKKAKFKKLSNSTLKQLAPVMKEDEEFLEMRKLQPQVTRVGYDCMKAYQTVVGMKFDEPYKSEYKKAMKGFKAYSGVDSMDRNALTIMKPVVRDKKGTIKITYYQRNDTWNKDWLKAWKDNDVNTQEKMIAQQYPHAFDQVKDIPIPNEAQLKNPYSYMRVLNEWIEKKLEADKVGFLFAIHKELSTDALSKAFKGMPQFLKDNKKYELLDKVLGQLNQYMIQYFADIHKIDLAAAANNVIKDDTIPVLENGEANLVNAPKIMQGVAGEIAKIASQYGEVKDAPDVEYKKLGKSKPKKA